MTGRATTQADLKLADQLLGLLPRLGQVWASAVHETGTASVMRMKVLGTLARSGPTRAGELAAFCSITPSAMTELIEGLVDDGRARRDPDPSDRRAVLIAVTPDGQSEVDRVVAVARTNVLELIDGLRPEQRVRLGMALTDLDNALTAHHQKETRNVR